MQGHQYKSLTHKCVSFPAFSPYVQFPISPQHLCGAFQPLAQGLHLSFYYDMVAVTQVHKAETTLAGCATMTAIFSDKLSISG